MSDEPVSPRSAAQISDDLALWILAVGDDSEIPPLDDVQGFKVRRFESLEAVNADLPRTPPAVLVLVGCPELGGTIRELRLAAPATAVIVWSCKRDPNDVAQAIAAGAQIYSTDRRASMMVPRIHDAVARQRRSLKRRDHLERRLAEMEREHLHLVSLVRSVSQALDRDLTALLGRLDEVFDHLPEPSPLVDPLDFVDVCASRASELVQELAAYTGSRRLVPEPFDLSELTDEVLVLLRACLAPTFEPILNPGFNLPLVEADPTRIRRLVVDLVSAIVEAPGVASGKVTLSTGARECDRELLQEIRGGDAMRTGPFVYFEVAAETIPDLPRDLPDGEGFDAVEDLLRDHYGGLRLRRDAANRLVAQAFLPAFDRPAEDDVPLAKGWHPGGAVLLVEPNAMARASVVPTLERLGFEVQIAEDGLQADKAFREHHGDFVVVVIDAHLEDPPTRGLVSRLAAARPESKILISSGRGETEVLPAFSDLPVHGFLRKPFRVVGLRRILRRVLDLDDGDEGRDLDDTAFDLPPLRPESPP